PLSDPAILNTLGMKMGLGLESFMKKMSLESIRYNSDYSLIAQSVERRTVNPQVPGSSPGRGAKFSKAYRLIGL
ncbi:MAG: hypothetical protein RLZZ452_919, partial [Pseudomonadota bacterium]